MPDPAVLTHPAQSTNTAFQLDSSQVSAKPKLTCLAPRASAIKELGFFEAVVARIKEDQPDQSMRKWTIFTKWCLSNEVDLMEPPAKSIAEFLMYLFQDRKLQPSTIDGYRSAIADKLGNSPINVRKDENLPHLLDTFHRDRPKGRIPSWNLFLMLHQLTKSPFEISIFEAFDLQDCLPLGPGFRQMQE